MCGIFSYIGTLPNNVERYLNTIQYRGPDKTNYKLHDDLYLGFHRLSINDLSDNGLQPMTHKNCDLICNGEIYNFRELKQKYNFITTSDSDCEVILHMYNRLGIKDTVQQLDGVFSFILYDKNINQLFAARDVIGVRPLFIGYNNNDIAFASEAKALVNLCLQVTPFLPGTYKVINLEMNNAIMKESLYIPYFNWDLKQTVKIDQKLICDNINNYLTKAVSKRLMSDRPIGCFLSGGLDSSVICSLMSKQLKHKVVTFAIGMADSNSPDLHYAKIVSDFLKTDHHEVTYTFEEGFRALDDLICTLESYDITTIRASMPQYLLSKYIQENTDIKVLFSGEGPDEHFGGYQYLKMAPNNDELQKELMSLTTNLHLYDVLRTDRTTARFGLEVRVPFLDKEFIKYSLQIPAECKRSDNRIEKFLIRKAFDYKQIQYLPNEILWRRKNAFSDAVGYQWVDRLVAKIDTLITDDEFENRKNVYKHNPPISKEALYYRQIFEKHYPNRGQFIPKYWMPKSDWMEHKMTDPSALKLGCFKE